MSHFSTVKTQLRKKEPLMQALIDLGWKVITANRSPLRAEAAAVKLGLPFGQTRKLQHIYLDLSDPKNGYKKLA